MVVLCLISVPFVACAEWIEGRNKECYLEDSGNDTYYFCGEQTRSCAGVGAWKKNVQNMYFNHESFAHDGLWYLCCGGTGSKEGVFKKVSDRWKTETVTERFPDGKCEWVRKTSACGDVLNPQDKCTEPVPCATGEVWHPGADRCVKPCKEGEGFESYSSPNCVACPETVRQTIVKGICKKCSSNQFWDKKQNGCVNMSSFVAVPGNVHDACWLCPTPGTVYNCLKMVAQNGSMDGDPTLKALCSVEGINAVAGTDIDVNKKYPLNLGEGGTMVAVKAVGNVNTVLNNVDLRVNATTAPVKYTAQ